VTRDEMDWVTDEEGNLRPEVGRETMQGAPAPRRIAAPPTYEESEEPGLIPTLSDVLRYFRTQQGGCLLKIVLIVVALLCILAGKIGYEIYKFF